MTQDELIYKYRELNDSFTKSLVFHIGVNAGFFSELNNMILAVLYCLKNKIKFILYSDDANFKLKDGYSDIFIPFCPEIHDNRISKLNFRWYNKEREKFRVEVEALKKELNIDYFTQDLWLEFTKYLHFNIPELEIRGKTEVAARQIMPLIWNFNTSFSGKLQTRYNTISIKYPYTGFHIRGGDKNIEAKIIPGEEYIKKAEDLNCPKNGFILTDDYRIFNSLEQKYTDWNFYTLCGKEEHGYYFDEYLQLSKQQKFEQLINLIASVEIISKSEKFIGTYNANPGMFLGMKMPTSKIYGMDRKHWDYRGGWFYIKAFIKKCLGIKLQMK